MKEVYIAIKIDEVSGKIATVVKTTGFNSDNISHQFELLGIYQNLVSLQEDKLKTKFQTGKKL